MQPFFAEKIMTPRLCLRRLGACDIPLIVSWSNSALAYGEYLTPERLAEEQGRTALHSGALWTEDNKVFLIEKRVRVSAEETGYQPIGTLHYWLRSESKGCAVMALKISEPGERNKGFGTEAQKYAIIQLFSKLKIQRVEMYTDINNLSQQRCLKKLGFELVESLCYDDRDIRRVGNLYRLDSALFSKTPAYHYHYES